ncbi:ABC transporter substrate-binding protein [Parasphaerochaeta coccoides]|uniref:Extracellular ligand-binding receptor n=1 Tax=Parasphaerochaeta coccoides (strain ATCC BAA-1237 / DSM 17374 / SPN1) TaxID=760011 RepID=F4GKB7_PARC1|nr:ABC transporter substrate-binding protein [Parasphaerochaeta coccoides]AEC02313.1 Extracellular ligand-binding receptor [Parasphaerochaeta coccoides DSM 17374]
MKKKILLMLVLALVGSLAVFAGGSKESAGSAAATIGFIGPLTGDNANYGILTSQAARLAVEQFNAKGGIAGTPVTLRLEDSEGNAEKALAAIEKLSGTDKIVALAGPVFTGESFAVGERVQNEGIAMISPSATHKDITAIGNYVFRTVVSDGLQGEVAGNYFYEVLGYRNIAVLYAKNDYSQGLYEGMSASFVARGGKIVIAETLMVGDKDFKTQLTKIRAANPEAIYIPNYTAEMAQILEQANQLGITVPFLSCDGFSDPAIYDLAGNFTHGVIYLGPAKVAQNEVYDKFLADYQAKWGVGPDSFATNMFDGTNIILNALKSVHAATGGFDRAKVRDAIAATKDYIGANGVINFAENGDLVAYQGVYKVNGKTPEYLGTYTVENGKLIKLD